jgi:hypothetical protein
MAIFTFNQALKKSGVQAKDVKSLGVPNTPEINQEQGFIQEAGSDIKQIGTEIASSFRERESKMQEARTAQSQGKQSGFETFYQNAGQGAGLVSDVFGSIIKGGIKAVLPQSAEEGIKSGVKAVSEPIVNLEIVKSVIEKYNSLDEETKRNLESTLGLGSLAFDVATAGFGKKAVEIGVKTGIKTGLKATEAVVDTTKNIIKPVTDTIENIGKKLVSPDVSEATKVSLNPKKALGETGQDIQVSVGGKLKKLSELSPEENIKMQISTSKSIESFTEQAKKFARDRSVKGGSPVEMVGNRVDKVLDFADRKRQTIGKKMGEIEIKYKGESLPVGEKVTNNFIETIKNFDNPKYGVDTADAKIVRKLVDDFDNLVRDGATVGERLDFVRSWDKYLNDAKDAFGKFKENATVNTRIQNAIKSLKDETVDSISLKDVNYRNLRGQYRTYKQLDEIGDSLLGKDGALGQRIKGAATVKRAIQSNSDAGARQFLMKLKELTGYDAIKEGDLALTAMENAGDYQGLSLLNIVKEGKSGFINKALEAVVKRTVGDNPTRVKKYIEAGN